MKRPTRFTARPTNRSFVKRTPTKPAVTVKPTVKPGGAGGAFATRVSTVKPIKKPQPSPIKHQVKPTKPVVTRPTTVKPTVIKPTVIKPGVTKPTVIKPGVVKPGVIKPGIVKPGVIKPGIIKPGVIKPGIIKPGTIKPTDPSPGITLPGTIKPGVIKPGVILDPDVLDDLLGRKNSNDPLLLLPLRLEYRVVQRNARLLVMDNSAKVKAVEAARLSVKGTSKTAVVSRQKSVEKARKTAVQKPGSLVAFTPQKEDHIWFRWFPDSNFAEDGIAAPSPEEIEARDTFLSADARGVWPDLRDEGVNQAWQTFVAHVGLARAIHLMRSRGDGTDPNWDKRVGRIAALPSKVKLFALEGERITELATGAGIPPNTAAESSPVSYAPDQLADLEWMTDFDAAVRNGMGVRISDQDMVEKALKADWIIAVGLHPGKAEDEVETLLRDQIANGDLEFLEQDAPTNNSPSGTTDLRAQPADVIKETGKATHREGGGTQAGGAAALLAEALGMSPSVLEKGINAADQAFADAQAMMRVVGPALLDEAMDGKTHLTDVSETEFLDAMAAAVVARGALSPMRIGDNAYGVATITDIREIEYDNASADPKDRVEAFMGAHASGLRLFYPSVTAQRATVIQPDDPDASDKLEEILKINRVSTRLDVGDAGSTSTRSIGCPYVTGRQDDHKPTSYLEDLRRESIDKLPDPTASDRNWPLLYRLARQTLTRNTSLQIMGGKLTAQRSTDMKLRTLQSQSLTMKRQTLPAMKSLGQMSVQGLSLVKPGSIAGVTPQVLEVIRTANAAFSDATHHLGAIASRDGGTAQLEVLMLEVFDLFQHRLDAWAIGLAYSRMKEVRAENRNQSLFAGYYGMLGRLRKTSATAANDGYIQAPTAAHATSAAVMRSAYLRHRDEGAFAINLRSARATRAMKLLEMLRKGLTLGEALGLRGERWLRDNLGAGEILPLRQKFPLKTSATDPTPQRLFDGLALVEGSTSGLNTKQQQLRKALSEDLDAISDLVTAEAVHLRCMGATDAAAAWLDVLSGGSVPGAPSVLKTQRYGHGSDHRLTLVLPEAAKANPNAPRTVGDASFAAMAENVLPDFAKATVSVRAALVEDPETLVEARLGLQADLKMTAMDFVVGGVSEVRTRAGHIAKRRWIEGAAPFSKLGKLPAAGTASALSSDVIWDINTDEIENKLRMPERAEHLRRIGQRARPMDAADLNAAADPSKPLTEAEMIVSLTHAVSDMSTRASTLSRIVDQRGAMLLTARNQFFRDAFALAGSAQGTTMERLAQQSVSLLKRWTALQDMLWGVAGLGLPQALRLESAGDMLSDLRGAEERIMAYESALKTKSKGLRQAISAARTADLGTAAALRGVLSALMEAMQGALDGDAMPIAPVYPRTAPTTPLLDKAVATTSALAEWARVRKAVRGAHDLLGSNAKWKVYPVLAKATDDTEDDDTKVPSEAEEPVARHFGLFLSSASAPAAQKTYSGFVVDDWTEQRPSLTQDAAIAVNYDTPQSEAPNCLLLCVPPKSGTYSWTEDRAAQMVRETIMFMQIRALATHDHLASPTLRPGMNRVAYAGTGAKQTARIPQASLVFKTGNLNLADGQLVRTSLSSKTVQSFQRTTQERVGFTRIKE